MFSHGGGGNTSATSVPMSLSATVKVDEKAVGKIAVEVLVDMAKPQRGRAQSNS
jgi:hypothetical protein